MNNYLSRLFFLRGFYIRFHILSFCPWEMLYHNMFLTLYWYCNSIAISTFYNWVSKDNCCWALVLVFEMIDFRGCESFSFWINCLSDSLSLSFVVIRMHNNGLEKQIVMFCAILYYTVLYCLMVLLFHCLIIFSLYRNNYFVSQFLIRFEIYNQWIFCSFPESFWW